METYEEIVETIQFCANYGGRGKRHRLRSLSRSSPSRKHRYGKRRKRCSCHVEESRRSRSRRRRKDRCSHRYRSRLRSADPKRHHHQKIYYEGDFPWDTFVMTTKSKISKVHCDQKENGLCSYPSTCSTNWKLLSKRLEKLEEQLSNLDAKGVLEVQKNPSVQKEKSDESVFQPSPTNSIDTYKSEESEKAEIKEIERPDSEFARKRRLTPVMEYFADRKGELKPHESRTAISILGSRHFIKSTVMQNFPDVKPRIRDSKDKIRTFLSKNERPQTLHIKRETTFSKIRNMSVSKSRPKILIRKNSGENLHASKSHEKIAISTPLMAKLNKNTLRKRAMFRPQKLIGDNHSKRSQESLVSKKSKKQEPAKNLKKSKKKTKSNTLIKNESLPKKISLRNIQKKNVAKKEEKKQTKPVKKSSEVLKKPSITKVTSSIPKVTSSIPKVCSSIPKISASSSNGDPPKYITYPKSKIIPLPMKPIVSTQYKADVETFSNESNADSTFVKEEESIPSPKQNSETNLEDKKSVSEDLPVEQASSFLSPKTRHLTDMEVQILVRDVEQISSQIQKYIKKWDEVLKTDTTADRDEDIRKTVFSACHLLDTKLKRAKELLLKYKALTSGDTSVGSPTSEMLEALLYYQLTQLDVSSVIKTFKRLDSMLTSRN